MGVIKKGVLGGFSGKVGPVVGSSWKGIDVMRAMPQSVANPRTAKQVEQRRKFTAASQFASSILDSWIHPIINRQARRMSGYNLFMQWNIDRMVIQEGQDFEHPLVVSKGHYENMEISGIEVTDKAVTVYFTDESIDDHPSGDDEIYFLVVEKFGKILFSGFAGYRDNPGAIGLELTEQAVEDTVFVYVVTKSADGRETSNAYYKEVTIS